MKQILIYSLLLSVLVLSACQRKEARDVVPPASIAVMALEPSLLPAALSQPIVAAGIDTTQTAYAFELPDGTLGLVAAVGSASSSDLSSQLPQGFIAEQSSGLLLVMGPCVASAEKSLRRRMTKFLEDSQPAPSRLLARLDSLPHSPIALVARTTALPSQYASLLLPALPEGAADGQLLLSATAAFADSGHRLDILGQLFSYHARTEEALQQTLSCLRPMSDSLQAAVIGTDTRFALFVNVEGTAFLNLLRRDQGLRLMLAAQDTRPLESSDGDVTLLVDASGLLRINGSQQKGGAGPRLRAVANLHALQLDSLLGATPLGEIQQVTYTMR